jgi:hypothetical protein
LCLDLAGDERRIELYDYKLRKKLLYGESLLTAVQAYWDSENPANLKCLESFLLMIPNASRLPLVTITSRPLLLSMRTDRALYRLLDSNVETRESVLDAWEVALQAYLTGHSFNCSYTPVNSGCAPTFSQRHRTQPLSSLSAKPNLKTGAVYGCEGLGIQTYRAIGYGLRVDYRMEGVILFCICRDGKALIHTEDLDLSAQTFYSH